MKAVHALPILSLAILAALASPDARADDRADDRGWYLGASVGQSRAKIDEPRIVGSLLTPGFSTVYTTDDDLDAAYKGFLGYRMGPNFALETGYVDFGQFGYFASVQPPGTLTGVVKVRGVHLDALGIMPLGDRLSAFVRAGVIYARARNSFFGTGSVAVFDPRRSETDTSFKFGVGLDYDFGPNWSVRGEAERYRIDDAVGVIEDVDLLSLGLVYRFARASAPYVAPLREAAPSPAPASPDCSTLDDDRDGVNNCDDRCPDSAAGQTIGPDGCPVPLTIDLRGVNFDFDRDTLRPDAVVILDEAIGILKQYPQLRFEVAGHTDAIGSDGYNMQLSQRRAQVVYDYLSDRGIDRSRMVGPTGYGEARPIAPNQHSDGSDDPDGRARNRRTELNVEN
ncbi:MAG TPA: outer membrane beta-barrel protein [Arenimonas sp.]|nr:outer membrane beta-barrel protein [Arenimonas sp.]